MLKCKEVSNLTATGHDAELGFMKKMELWMHLMMCVHCRRYVAQIRAIGRGTRGLVHGQQAAPAQLDKMETHIVECCCGRRHDDDHE